MRKMTFGILAIAGFFLLQGAMLWIQNIKSADAQTMICVPEQKRTIEGAIEWTGPASGGTWVASEDDFSITLLGSGLIRVNFTEPFSSTPTVIATPKDANGLRIIIPSSATSSSVTLASYTTGGYPTWGPIGLIVVGDD